MERRLTKYDYIISVLLVLCLAASTGAYLYGVKSGQEKAALRYERLIDKQKEEKQIDTTAYHQQHLVSFYYTVYMPYREFQRKWFEHRQQLEMNSGTVDNASLLRELEKVAAKQYNEAAAAQVPSASPLLQEAQQSLIKSLKLFADGAKGMTASANSFNGPELIKEMDKAAYFQEAENFALTGQNQFYESIVQWNKSIVPDLKGLSLVTKQNLTLNEWGRLNLNIKNQFVSAYLRANKQYTAYLPQDIAIRVDELIASGQAKKLGIGDIALAITTLTSTGAVRSGDFINQKSRFYPNETLPQLPFFSN